MPKRKISIDEAFKVLEEAGIPLQVKQQEAVLSERIPVNDTSVKSATVPKPVLGKLVKITLFAKHSIGSGGTVTGEGTEKVVEHAGVQTYGPGICIVNSELASHLLSADGAARAADARMLDREQHSYLIVQRVGTDGSRANVGLGVPDGFLDERLSNLPLELMHLVR